MAELPRLSNIELRDVAYAFVRKELGVTRNELLSHRRQAHLVEARALFVWIVKSFGPEDLSYPRIGRWLGGRDHTTIQHLWKIKAPQLRATSVDFELLCERFAFCMNPATETPHVHTRH